MSWYTMGQEMMEDPKEKADYIPVDGSAVSEPVKAVKYKSKPVSAPDQGFEGGDVAHAHMKTTTADWGEEYGPEAWWLHKPKASAQSISIVSGMVCLMAQFLFTA